jgi:hypothetical protein
VTQVTDRANWACKGVGLGDSYTAEALWPERLTAWELGGLPRPQTFVSAACQARPTDCISKPAALNFPFPVVKSADRSWR